MRYRSWYRYLFPSGKTAANLLCPRFCSMTPIQQPETMLRLNRLGPAAVLLLAASLLLSGTGCSSLSSLGFPSPGRYQLMRTTQQMAAARLQRAPIATELDKGVLHEYRVEPGDTLLLETADFDADIRLPGDVLIEPDGCISLGKYGRVGVARKTIPEIQAVVQQTVNAAEEEPGEIVVQLARLESQTYYVLGEVNAPDRYELKGNETVLDAIVTAGNLTASANRQKIILVRPTAPNDCRVVLPVCYRHIVQLGDTSTNYQIEPGDRIYVASLGFSDDLKQTLFPFFGENCPRCHSCQQNCHAGHEHSRLVPAELKAGNLVAPLPPRQPERNGDSEGDSGNEVSSGSLRTSRFSSRSLLPASRLLRKTR